MVARAMDSFLHNEETENASERESTWSQNNTLRPGMHVRVHGDYHILA